MKLCHRRPLSQMTLDDTTPFPPRCIREHAHAWSPSRQHKPRTRARLCGLEPPQVSPDHRRLRRRPQRGQQAAERERIPGLRCLEHVAALQHNLVAAPPWRSGQIVVHGRQQRPVLAHAPHTRHQNRSPRIPTLTSVPLWTQGLGAALSLVSNVCARSSSAAVAMREGPRETPTLPRLHPPFSSSVYC